ncbi:HTH domain-containing protein [Butyrivibrio sp. ob235]|uniref:helix-turn-helix transcriptional regulator n=1 Tax=Butyrivibrio sp. ob235 TaxID=1761780 RepID=UPI0008B48683|nr:WYL domain-containing protein [Butyrivibrio sp. ob235]SEM39161.1 HTH domain-containing protein [Butyrivibrio sp. ob235]
MSKADTGKERRVLSIYTELLNGKTISKAEMAEKYGVDVRSIQRDLADIRSFIEESTIETGIENDLVYDAKQKGFRLEQTNKMKFTNDEVLAICKILLDSRAFRKDDMETILNKLMDCCVPKKNQKMVNDLISNEKFHYVPPRHNKHVINNLWNIGCAIRDGDVLEISYKRLKEKKTVKRRIQPLGIMFSEYYFYLMAFIDEAETRKDFDVINDSSPTIYRIDRIQEIVSTGEKFHIPYSSRFEEGEFRKRVQFMYGGRINRVKFLYKGMDIDAILDRLPTAKIIKTSAEGQIVSAEVFGNGIEMWLRSQGDTIEII